MRWSGHRPDLLRAAPDFARRMRSIAAPGAYEARSAEKRRPYSMFSRISGTVAFFAFAWFPRIRRFNTSTKKLNPIAT
jgi:hypothetical protein